MKTKEKKNKNLRRIKIFDTTLRDGEQSPGATLNLKEKVIIAKQLEKLNVDIIEAGFPIASEDDFKAVNEISKTVKKPIVCALARCLEKDILRAAEALEPAKKSRIHVFLATSPIHMKYKLKKTPKEVIEDAVKGVKLAKQYFEDVEFSPEDASRTKPEFLYEILSKTIDAGATVVNIPDTVGYAQPNEYGLLIKNIRENVENISDVAISVHCHNDLGLAVANSLEGVRNGATQVECTVNGIGERAGNAALEEIVTNIYAKGDYFNAYTNIDLSEIYNTSKMVSNFTGIVVQPNKAIVGKNAFAHEAGIHQHGVLCNRTTYEIINPKLIGRESEIVIGKHSGKHAIENFLKNKGFSFSKKEIDEITMRIKALADKQKKVFEEDILAIAYEIGGSIDEKDLAIKIDELIVNTGNKINPNAVIKLSFFGKEIVGFGKGVGPVDAVSKAVKSAIGEFKLKEYNLKAITGGTDALAEVVVVIEHKGKEYYAEAVDEDVVMASTKAIVKALNYAYLKHKKSLKKRKSL